MQNINKLFLLLILTLAGSSLWCAEQKSAGEQKAGVEVKVSNEDQDNLNERFLWAVKRGYEITELLGKVDIDAQDADGNTALMFAADKGHVDITNLLLINGADPDIQDEEGCTAFIWAARQGGAEAELKSEYDYMIIIGKLCAHGANPNLKDKQNNSALKYAELFGFGKMAKQIKLYLADYNTYYDLYKQSVSPECSGAMNFGQFLVLTLDEQGTRIIEKLQKEFKISKEEQDSLNRQLISAAYRGDIKRVTEFIVGADVNAINEHGNTALILAADQEHKNIVELLLNNGANTDIPGEQGFAALIATAYRGYVDIVILLLNKGANPDIRNDASDTALIHAASKGYLGIVNLLLIYGANPDILSAHGNTALMIAVNIQAKNIVEALLKYGAKPNLGHVLCGDKEIEELIKKYAEYYSQYHAQYEQYKLSAVNSLNASIAGITGMPVVIAPVVTGYSRIMIYQEFIDWKEEKLNKELDAALDLYDKDDAQEKSEQESKYSGSQACSPATPEPAAAAAQRATLSGGQAPISAFDLGVMLVDQPEEAREYILRLLALNKITPKQ